MHRELLAPYGTSTPSPTVFGGFKVSGVMDSHEIVGFQFKKDSRRVFWSIFYMEKAEN